LVPGIGRRGSAISGPGAPEATSAASASSVRRVAGYIVVARPKPGPAGAALSMRLLEAA